MDPALTPEPEPNPMSEPGLMSPEATSFEGTPEYWIYGDAYENWLNEKIGVDGWTIKNLRAWDLLMDAKANPEVWGTHRPGSPNAGIMDLLGEEGYETPAPEGDPFVRGESEFDVGLAGGTPFAPGILTGEEFGDYQIEDMLERDPWGTDWNLPPPMSIVVPDISEEDQGAFLAADRFFNTLQKQADEAGASSIETYLLNLQATNPELFSQVRPWYDFHGNNWDRIAPDYFRNAQASIIKLTEDPGYADEAAGYIEAILPIAGQLAPALGMSPEALYQQLEGLAEQVRAGESVDMSWLTDPARGMGGGDSGGAGDAGGEQGGTQEPTDDTADADTLPNDVFGSSHVSGATFNNVFSGDLGELSSEDAVFTSVPDAAWEAGKLGGISGNQSYNDLSEVEIPSFVLSQQGLGSGYADPVSYWMSLSPDQQSKFISAAEDKGMNTDFVSIKNPE